jgi:SAM-dependent methyltransferase
VNSGDREYVLGTHDEEVDRLALQHRAWRGQVLDVWRRAGFGRGQSILDLGCGAGDATLDLAAMVGAEGQVVAVDQSRRFLDLVEARARAAGIDNVRTFACDLDRDPLPSVAVDGVWDRWVASFVRDPRSLIAAVAGRLKPGGVLVIHEYFDYATWRTAPPSAEIDRFVHAVIDAWRRSGGEPNLGLHLPVWLDDAGFSVRDVQPIVESVAPGDLKWQWLAAFVESGRRRLEALGAISEAESREIGAALARAASDPRVRMMTPALLEIVAVRRPAA